MRNVVNLAGVKVQSEQTHQAGGDYHVSQGAGGSVSGKASGVHGALAVAVIRHLSRV